jgi:hypothetical protein
MKVTIEYNLPDEIYEFKRDIQAADMMDALDTIREELRQRVKYEKFDKEKIKTAYEAYEEFYASYFEILDDKGVKLSL